MSKTFRQVTDGTPDPASKPYQPWGNLKDIFYCKDPEVLIEGPVRTGKTRALLEKSLMCAEKYPKCRILWVRKTKQSLGETVLQTFEDHVLPDGHYLLDGGSRRYKAAYEFRNGSTIVLGGMDNPTKILSSEYDIVICFEASEFALEDWETLVTRVNNEVIPYNQIFADTNPAHPRHWLNQRAGVEPNVGMTRIKSRLEDNPKFYDHKHKEWTTGGQMLIDKLERLTGVRYLRLRKGLWAAAEGLVYPDFNPETHIIDPFPIPKDWRRFRCIDFGFVNPFVCQWWALDNDGVAYLYREIYQTKTLVSEHAAVINGLTGTEYIDTTVSDHDAEDRATLHKEGIITVPAEKSVLVGVEVVSNRLKIKENNKAGMYIFRNALHHVDPLLSESLKPYCTAQEFETYIYPKTMEGKELKEQPAKLDDHGMDALRYAMMHLDGGVVPGFHSLTPERDPIKHGKDVLTSEGFSGIMLEKDEPDEDFDSVMENPAAWV